MEMGFRFKRSVKLFGGLRLNLSKSGVGNSGGVPGFRVSAGPSGVRRTLSLPGTGISFVSQSGTGRAGKQRRRSNSVSGLTEYNKRALVLRQLPRQVKGDGLDVALFVVGVGFIFAFPVVGVPLAATGGIWMWRLRATSHGASRRAFDAARVRYLNGRDDLAAERLAKAIEQDPGNTDAHFLMMTIANDVQHQPELVAKHAAAIRASHPNNLVVNWTLAEALCDLHRPNDALPIVRELQQSPAAAHGDIADRISTLLGRCLFELGQFDTAITQLKDGPAARRNMDDVVLEAKYWLGLACLRSGDVRKAKTPLTKVFLTNPKFRDVEALAKEIGISSTDLNIEMTNARTETNVQCPTCGSVLVDEATPCQECARSRGQQSSPAVDAQPLSSSPPTPWYFSTLVVLTALIAFFPLGLLLMWTGSRWTLGVRLFVTVLCVPLLLSVIGALNQKSASGGGAKPVTTESETAKTPIQITSTALADAYQKGGTAADSVYKKQRLLIEGAVRSVTNSASTVAVSLATRPGQSPLRAVFSDKEKGKAASLRKGQQVRLLCTGRGRESGSLLLADCMFP
jgi:Tfp pilus assembly protein PilF